jgi:hypothetical protein
MQRVFYEILRPGKTAARLAAMWGTAERGARMAAAGARGEARDARLGF